MIQDILMTAMYMVLLLAPAYVATWTQTEEQLAEEWKKKQQKLRQQQRKSRPLQPQQQPTKDRQPNYL
jgi:hypothetical protein